MGGRRRTSDHFTKRAKRENYPARSIYKLEEIDRRVKLLKPGHSVLDLGAAPGSWTLYASKVVGPSGRVVSVDRMDLLIGTPNNVTFMRADALSIDPSSVLSQISSNGFDAVISDMAPATSGHRFTDQTRSFNLFNRALELAAELCRKNGSFVGKIFQGEDFETARARLKEFFGKSRVIKPSSVRTESYEIYLVGLERL